MKFKKIVGILSLSSIILSNYLCAFAFSFKDSLSYVNNSLSPVSCVPKPVIVLDPGHGGSDPGAVCYNVKEKDLNLDISLKLGKLLESRGLKVIYTRKTDIFIGLKERAQLANAAKASLFISIHNNSLPSNYSHRGTETLYSLPSSGKPYPYNINGKGFADIIQKEMVSILGTTNDGLKYRPNLAVLKYTNMPAVITEVAFMSNKNDISLLTNNNFRQKAANAIASGATKALAKMGKS